MIDPLLLITHDTNIWGVFHSHPDERFTTPSEQDLKLLVYDSLKFILYVDNKFYIYWYDRDKNIKRYEIFNASHIENS
jgi:proteasome lid subunit RPN8/RPN11